MTDPAVATRRSTSLDAVFAPVHSQTAFEETVDRLGTAIKLGLLPPGTRLPAERELCARLGIARSTLRQALVALGQSGHLRATRGRGGGHVRGRPPASGRRRRRRRCWPRGATCATSGWRVEIGVAVLAAERAQPASGRALEELVAAIDGLLEDFAAYRQARRAPARRAGRGRPAARGWSAR